MTYITRDDVYRATGLPTDGSVISTADMDAFILEGESKVERFLQTSFQPGGVAVTETKDGDGSNIIFTDRYPLITLTAVTIDGTSVTPSQVYQWPETGKLQLKSTAEKTFFDDGRITPLAVELQYTYGETPDERIKRFTILWTGITALTAQIGGTFDDITSFSMPEIQGSLGEPFTNIREGLTRLKNEADEMINRGIVRPKALFG